MASSSSPSSLLSSISSMTSALASATSSRSGRLDVMDLINECCVTQEEEREVREVMMLISSRRDNDDKIGKCQVLSQNDWRDKRDTRTCLLLFLTQERWRGRWKLEITAGWKRHETMSVDYIVTTPLDFWVKITAFWVNQWLSHFNVFLNGGNASKENTFLFLLFFSLWHKGAEVRGGNQSRNRSKILPG